MPKARQKQTKCSYVFYIFIENVLKKIDIVINLSNTILFSIKNTINL
jgi:hypothetical protein